MDGRRVKTLHDGMLGAGQHDFVWDGTDTQGQPVASGIYLAVVSGQAESHSQRMVMLK